VVDFRIHFMDTNEITNKKIYKNNKHGFHTYSKITDNRYDTVICFFSNSFDHKSYLLLVTRLEIMSIDGYNFKGRKTMKQNMCSSKSLTNLIFICVFICKDDTFLYLVNDYFYSLLTN
jgi:hypothetical protein